jgi:succinoglycan biosynthesis protein ExoO
MPTVELLEEADFWVTPCAPASEPIRATIVIPTYNAQVTLLRALRSALDQTVRDIEVIVVDDGSTDSSWEIIAELLSKDSRLRAIRNKQNGGRPTGLNRGIALARGHWLAVLDADDWYAVDRLEALLGIAEARHADMVADNQYFFDAAAGKIVGNAWLGAKADWKLTFDDFLTGANAYNTFNLGMLKPVLSMEFIRRTSLSYEERARNGQDFFYLLQFYISGGKAVVTDVAYYYYTQPYGSISRRWSHAARRRYDFMTAYDINQHYLSDRAQALTRSQAALLRKRSSRLKSLEYFFQAKECLMNGDMGGAIVRIVRRPAMLPLLARRFTSYLLRQASSTRSEQSASNTIGQIATRSRRLAHPRRPG